MSEWIYFLHPPRDDFAATMTEEERAVWQRHFEWVDGLFEDGRLVMVGVTGGTTNTGVGIFEAPDERVAREIVSQDPAAGGGYALGELRAFELGLLRGAPANPRPNGEGKATVMIEYRLPTDAVAAFHDWKQVFDMDPVGRKAHGATSHRIHHDRDDRNHFMLELEFRSMEEAEAFLSEPALKQSWEASGAGQAWLLSKGETVTY